MSRIANSDITRRRSHCIFCGKPSNSKEHLFGKELVKRYSKAPKTLGRQVIDGKPFNHPVNRVDETGATIVQEGPFRRAGANATAQIVCSDCNNGWMSVIEKDFLLQYSKHVEDRTVQFSPIDQNKIAKWFYLKHVLIEECVGFIPPGPPLPSTGQVTMDAQRARQLKHLIDGNWPPTDCAIVLFGTLARDRSFAAHNYVPSIFGDLASGSWTRTFVCVLHMMNMAAVIVSNDLSKVLFQKLERAVGYSDARSCAFDITNPEAHISISEILVDHATIEYLALSILPEKEHRRYNFYLLGDPLLFSRSA